MAWARVSRWMTGPAFAMAMFLAAMAPGATAAATVGTTCNVSGNTTTCTTTDANGNIAGTCTCTVSGAPSCVPGGDGAAQVTSNLDAIRTELTPNVSAVFTNPVTAPLMRLGIFVLSCLMVWYLGASLVDLVVRVRHQARGEGVDHTNLHGPLFAVGVLLLLVVGGATWLLVGAVQGIQSLLHG